MFYYSPFKGYIEYIQLPATQLPATKIIHMSEKPGDILLLSLVL